MPQTHIGSLPKEQLQARRDLIRLVFDAAMQIWKRVGDGKVGIVLLDRYWSGDDPWVSADYIVAALDNLYSDDTIRRRLRQLVENQAVLQRQEGRLRLYALRPSFAEEVTSAMEQTAGCGKKPSLNRNLRENLVVIGPYEDS